MLGKRYLTYLRLRLQLLGACVIFHWWRCWQGGLCNRGNHRRQLGHEELPFGAIRRPGHRLRHRCSHNPVAGAVHLRRARGWLSQDLRDATAGG